MALLRVLTYGDGRLHRRSEAVAAMTDDLSHLIADMSETMYAAKGVGLAAPQVGVFERLFVLDVDQVDEDGQKNRPRRLRVFVNPEIVWASAEDSPYTEGCLSVPGIESEIYRPARIRARYRNERWEECEEEAEGMLARVVQHEIDHLDGILFVDRLGFVKRQMVAAQLRRLRNGRESIVVPGELATK